MNDQTSLNVEYLFNKLYNFFGGLKHSFYRFWSGDSPSSSGINGEGGVSSGNDSTSESSGGIPSLPDINDTSDGGPTNYSFGTGVVDGNGAEQAGGLQGFFGKIFDSFGDLLLTFKGLLELLSIILITITLYSLVRIYEIRKEEARKRGKPPIIIARPPVDRGPWEIVLKHAGSDNPADWRLAIIEADNMLDEMVKSMGYAGENLGDRLKIIEPSDFETLNQAWEAHRVRNRIVHEGTSFELSRTETDRIVTLYGNVFNEFEYI